MHRVQQSAVITVLIVIMQRGVSRIESVQQHVQSTTVSRSFIIHCYHAAKYDYDRTHYTAVCPVLKNLVLHRYDQTLRMRRYPLTLTDS